MRKITLIIWIFALFVIQEVFYPILSVSGLVPDLLLGFCVSYAVLEPRFKKVSAIAVICAVLSGTGTGRVFPVAVAMVALTGVLAYMSPDYLRFLPKLLRTGIIVALSAFLMCCVEFFAISKAITVQFLVNTALWYSLYTTALFCVIYLILSKTMLDRDKKILLVQERN